MRVLSFQVAAARPISVRAPLLARSAHAVAAGVPLAPLVARPDPAQNPAIDFSTTLDFCLRR